MSDLISRQAAIRAYCEYECGKGMIRGKCGCDDCGTIFDGIPSAQPERKKGKWMHDKDDSLISGYCSRCGWESIIMETDVADMPFCPNCGAKMEE